jgi:hypothetical protein
MSENVQTNDSEIIQFLKPFADKIIKLQQKLPKLTKIRKEILDRQESFLQNVKKDSQMYILFGFLCILAIVFDYFVSVNTMKPIAHLIHIPVVLLALLFSFIDLGVASLASGIRAKKFLEIEKMKKIWRPILWLLFLIKISLFIIFAINNTPIKGILIMIALALIVYFILDFAGKGIYFIAGKIKYWFLLEIWNEKPEDIENKIKNKCRNLKNEAIKANDGLNEPEKLQLILRKLDVEKICGEQK